MPSTDENAETVTAAQATSDSSTAVPQPTHASAPIQAEPVFIGHLPDGYQIPYGVTVHVLEPDETGALRDHRIAEDSYQRVDPVTHEVQQLYHGQVIDAQHAPQEPANNPVPEPIFIGQLPEHYEMPYGQTVHVLVQNEDGALVDHKISEEGYVRVNPETHEAQSMWHGQPVDPQHPPVPGEASAQTEPVFVGHLPEGYQFQPGVTVHVLEARPDEDGFRDHRMVEEPYSQREASTGDQVTIWHGTVIDRQHADGLRDEATQAQLHGDVPGGAEGAGFGVGPAHGETHADAAPHQIDQATHGHDAEAHAGDEGAVAHE